MTIDDRVLREAWRERAPAAAPVADCPDPERIWRAVTLDSSADERRSLIDHVAGCAPCAEAWRLAGGLVEREVSPRVTAVRRRSPTLPQWTLAAASIVAAVGLGWLVLQRETSPVEALRATEPAMRSLLEDGAALPRDRFLLRWTPGPKGTIYDIEVGTTDLKLLSRAMALTAPEYLVPQDALAGLAPGATIAWRVEATLPDGRVIASVTHFNRVR